MNQKRFLTLLPIIFLVIATIVVGGFYFAYQNDDLTCEENEYKDLGLNLNFAYPCGWDVINRTEITSEFVYDQEQDLFGPVAQSYEINLEKDDAEINVSVVLQAIEGTKRTLDGEYDYEKISDGIVRFRRNSNEMFRYADYISCSELPTALTTRNSNAKDCADSFISGLGTQFPVIITIDNGKMDIEDLDEIVLEMVD